MHRRQYIKIWMGGWNRLKTGIDEGFSTLQKTFEEQWWRSGASTRLPPMWPRFDNQTWRHIWVEFVGSPLSSERFFPGYSDFPLSSKPYI